jgi:hypothetical protein
MPTNTSHSRRPASAQHRLGDAIRLSHGFGGVIGRAIRGAIHVGGPLGGPSRSILHAGNRAGAAGELRHAPPDDLAGPAAQQLRILQDIFSLMSGPGINVIVKNPDLQARFG